MRRVKIIPKHLDGIGFLSTKAGSYSGTPQSTVQLWTKQGFIKPEIQDTTGKGVRRLYSALNVIEIGIIRLLSQNVPEKIVGQIMEFLSGYSPDKAGKAASLEKELTKLENLLGDDAARRLEDTNRLKQIIQKIEKAKRNAANEARPSNLERLLEFDKKHFDVVTGYLDIFFSDDDNVYVLGRVKQDFIDLDTEEIMSDTMSFIGGDVAANDRLVAKSDKILTINLTKIAKRIIKEMQ